MSSQWKIFHYHRLKHRDWRKQSRYSSANVLQSPNLLICVVFLLTKTTRQWTRPLAPMYMARKITVEGREAYNIQKTMEKLGFVFTVSMLGKAISGRHPRENHLLFRFAMDDLIPEEETGSHQGLCTFWCWGWEDLVWDRNYTEDWEAAVGSGRTAARKDISHHLPKHLHPEYSTRLEKSQHLVAVMSLWSQLCSTGRSCFGYREIGQLSGLLWERTVLHTWEF